MKIPAASVRDVAVAGALTGWVLITGLSQHPNRAFDRFRKFDKTATAIPNWRFFAPEPAVHDFRILHRHMDADGTVSPWRETTTLHRRTAGQMVWFPDRRRDKAISDICNEVITQLNSTDIDVTRLPAYRLLRDLVGLMLAAEAPADPDAGPASVGFQFLVARNGGYDESIEPEYLFASPFERWPADAAA
jgi:hypothetical protein